MESLPFIPHTPTKRMKPHRTHLSDAILDNEVHMALEEVCGPGPPRAGRSQSRLCGSLGTLSNILTQPEEVCQGATGLRGHPPHCRPVKWCSPMTNLTIPWKPAVAQSHLRYHTSCPVRTEQSSVTKELKTVLEDDQSPSQSTAGHRPRLMLMAFPRGHFEEEKEKNEIHRLTKIHHAILWGWHKTFPHKH